jgi:hypothetical protein
MTDAANHIDWKVWGSGGKPFLALRCGFPRVQCQLIKASDDDVSRFLAAEEDYKMHPEVIAWIPIL